MGMFNFVLIVVLGFGFLAQRKKIKGLLKEMETMASQVSDLVNKIDSDWVVPTDSHMPIEGAYEENTVSKVVDLEPQVDLSIEKVSAVVSEELVDKKEVVEAKPIPKWRQNLFSVESIISKLGILLLLIGVGYMFKLAYDNGYITEELALVFGGLMGGVFLYFGRRVGRRHRMVLSQVLYGGGVATFYITVYVAFEGYGLIPGILAFMFMVAVTGLGFVLAMITDSLAMSLIAILGGLLTPFILEITEIGLLGTGLYILVLSLAAMIIYVFKRWRMLQVSTIIGVYGVTSFFMTLEQMSEGEKVQLALLMTVLFLLFDGVAYVLAYLGKASTKSPMITYSLMGGLPLLTLLQVWMTLDLEEVEWSLIFALVAILYAALAYVINRHGVDSLVENITISYTGIFGLLGLVLYFGGDILVIAVLALALIYYGLAKRMNHLYIGLMGHVLGTIGYIMALSELLALTMDHSVTWTEFGVRTIILLMMLIGVYLNTGLAKWVMAIASIEVYMVSVIQIQTYTLTKDWEPLAVMILVHGILVVGLFLVNRRKRLLPPISILILGVLPFISKIMSTLVVVFVSEVNGYEVGAYLIYGAMMYVLAQWALGAMKPLIRVVIKSLVYSLLLTLVLGDLVVGTDKMVAGLLLAGGICLLIQWVEPDRLEKVMVIYRLVIRSLWLLWVMAYIMVGFGLIQFEWETMVLDMVLLPLIWLNLKHFKWSIPYVVKVGLQGLAFMMLVNKNLQMLSYGNGIITLLWAAYAIALLAYSVVKANKQLVTLSLAFIVAVAGKYILVDLASVSTVWKIIISMAFGSALLLLSYFLQPILSGQKASDEGEK